MLQHLTFHYLPLSILLLFLQRYVWEIITKSPLSDKSRGDLGPFLCFLIVLFCIVSFKRLWVCSKIKEQQIDKRNPYCFHQGPAEKVLDPGSIMGVWPHQWRQHVLRKEVWAGNWGHKNSTFSQTQKPSALRWGHSEASGEAWLHS